jgi:type IV pilus assembly protein PilA
MRKSGSTRGFILIELMLVVAIIGILAAVAIPAYQNYILRAKATEWQLMSTPLKDAISQYFDYWGKLPPDNAAAGLPAPEAYRSRYVESMQVKNGAVLVSLRYQEIKTGDSGIIVYFPELSAAHQPADDVVHIVSWRCYSGKPPAELAAYHLPTVPAAPPIYWRICQWPKHQS